MSRWDCQDPSGRDQDHRTGLDSGGWLPSENWLAVSHAPRPRTGRLVAVRGMHLGMYCHSGIEDIVKFYKLGMHVKFICEILVEAMEVPQHLKV